MCVVIGDGPWTAYIRAQTMFVSHKLGKKSLPCDLILWPDWMQENAKTVYACYLH